MIDPAKKHPLNRSDDEKRKFPERKPEFEVSRQRITGRQAPNARGEYNKGK